MQPTISSSIIRESKQFATVQFLGATDNFLREIMILVDFGENYGTPYCPEALDRTFMVWNESGLEYDRTACNWVELRGEIPWKTTKVLVTMKLDKRLENPQKFIAAKAKKLSKWLEYYAQRLPTLEEIQEDERTIAKEEEELYYQYHR